MNPYPEPPTFTDLSEMRTKELTGGGGLRVGAQSSPGRFSGDQRGLGFDS